jgi:uroporphyrin-III C-methyltransferase
MPAGTVALVGAGPGAPDLITVRGLARLRSADVVVYDRLVDGRLLDEVPAQALRIFVGKASGAHVLPQEQINAILIAHATDGRRVVRLKGGDPFVFGRGGEEAQALADAGIPCEVVPGVSSAVAVPASAGIPLTHRGVASSFAVVTGHDCDDGAGVDWPRLARSVDTLVVLMGLARVPGIARMLMTHGRAPWTPVAVIGAGTTDAQRTVIGALDDIAGRLEAADLSPPAIVVIGEVVGLARRLSYRQSGTQPEQACALASLVDASS